MKVHTSLRALAVALGPLAVLHLLTLAMTPPGDDVRFATPDAALGALAFRLGLDAGLFAILHLGLRVLRHGSRGAYAAIGAIAGVGSYAVGLWTGWWPRFAPEGATVTIAIAPLLAGAMGGFMYQLSAGFDWRASGAAGEAGPVDAAPSPPRPVFSGPVQVRTSLGAYATVALLPPAIFALVAVLFSFNHLAPLGRMSAIPGLRSALGGLSVPLAVLLTGATCFGLPALVLVSASHALARAWNRVDHRAYALIGFGCGAVLPLLIGARLGAVPFGLLGAAAAASYRRIAGLEPKALPEHILVRDRDALVSAHHPSRQEHRVVFEG